jgi:hypothetical protein
MLLNIFHYEIVVGSRKKIYYLVGNVINLEYYHPPIGRAKYQRQSLLHRFIRVSRRKSHES